MFLRYYFMRRNILATFWEDGVHILPCGRYADGAMLHFPHTTLLPLLPSPPLASLVLSAPSFICSPLLFQAPPFLFRSPPLASPLFSSSPFLSSPPISSHLLPSCSLVSCRVLSCTPWLLLCSTNVMRPDDGWFINTNIKRSQDVELYFFSTSAQYLYNSGKEQSELTCALLFEEPIFEICFKVKAETVESEQCMTGFKSHHQSHTGNVIDYGLRPRFAKEREAEKTHSAAGHHRSQ